MIENKKHYVKPGFVMMYFKLSDNIAACAETTETTYEEQTITCIVDGSETVFYSGCTDSASSGSLVTLGSSYGSYAGTYYVWYDGNVGGQPTSEQEKILSALGISGSGWHAGIASATIQSIVNSSK